jgi:hypothetical protein
VGIGGRQDIAGPWDLYYSADHIETIFRRGKASGIKPACLLKHIL